MKNGDAVMAFNKFKTNPNLPKQFKDSAKLPYEHNKNELATAIAGFYAKAKLDNAPKPTDEEIMQSLQAVSQHVK